MHKIHLSARPIVPNFNTVTTAASRLLDQLTKEVLRSKPLNSILVNSLELVNTLKQPAYQSIPKGALLVTMDVTQLYPSIPLDKLDLAFWEKACAHHPNQKLAKLISKLVNFIFNETYLVYDGTVYQQISGFPMGNQAAVNIANIFMYYYVDLPLMSTFVILLYKRYIDDIFMIWLNGYTRLIELVKQANQLLPSIKFTFQYSEISISFLDVSLYFSLHRNVYSEIFQKEMNNYLYLPFSSTHPLPVLKGWIKGELIRYKRLTTESIKLEYTCLLFLGRLLQRGYPMRFIFSIYYNVSSEPAHVPLLSRLPANAEVISAPLVMKYTNEAVYFQIKRRLKDMQLLIDMEIIKRNPNPSKLLKVFISYKKTQSLGDILTNRKFRDKDIEANSMSQRYNKAFIHTPEIGEGVQTRGLNANSKKAWTSNLRVLGPINLQDLLD